ncbi:MAG TPA: phage terminase small subunit P27 family [Longimicrobium sp.]|nr:phage terminase small subunit P27 family [Longimicrobium sp.]
MPAVVNEVRGNPGKRKPKPSPDLPAGAPECPAHLKGGARREWLRIVPQLEAAGLLAEVDGTALALYCVAFARWERAERELVKTGGEVVRSPTNDYPIQNPWLAVSNKATEQIHKYLAEFGMSPAARMRVAFKNNGDSKPKANPQDRFFTGPRAVA